METDLNPDQLRWALYSKKIPNGKPLNIPDCLVDRCGMWQAYQANELSHIAMESLLSLFLEMCPQEPAPVNSIIKTVVEKILANWKKTPHSWSGLRDMKSLAANPSDLKDENSEASLAQLVLDRGDPVQSSIAGIRLLAILDNRWPGMKHPVGFVYGKGSFLGARFPESIMGLLSFLRKKENEPLAKTLTELVECFVFEQHLSIALRKLYYQGKRTFLFKLQDGKIEKPLITSPVLTNPRISTSLAFLRDLYLLYESGLTAKGKKLLGVL